MIAIVKLFKYELLVGLFIIAFPLYVTVFITPAWIWLLFSLFYAVIYLFFVRSIRHYLKVLVLLFAILPFLFFDALLLVNYFIQGTGFNEAFYFHFNKQGTLGFQNEILILAIVMSVYYVYVCFLTFKLHEEKSDKQSGFFAGTFIILLALISPQTLSFGKMYLDAHDSQLLSGYFPFSRDYDDILIDQLIWGAGQDFKYYSGDKKNLVFIYAESLEANFFDTELIGGNPNALSAMQASSIVFSNMQQTSYTGWTIAGMVASLCGVPLQMPLASATNNFSLSADFMPNAECVSDLLKKEGYYLSFLGGANLNFAGKKAFLTTHSFDNIVGSRRFKEIYPENKHDYNKWGLRDRPLFEYAFDEYLELAAKPSPFALFLLTLDSHAPGFPDPACTERYHVAKENRMLDAVHCSSQLIKKYIQNIRNSPHSDDTVIVIMSDHLAHKNPADYLLKKKPRKLMFMLNLPSAEQQHIGHRGTHYDIGPTVLSAIGFDNCEALGFGRNMLSCAPESSSVNGREGLLHELFLRDKNILQVATHSTVKSFVHTKWGDFLGGIGRNGILVNDTDYTMTIGNKQFSYRNPQPFRNTYAGALLFKLAHNGYDIKDITSMRDNVRLPEQFSIEHWLANKKGLYLYIGNKSGLSSVDFSGDNDAENIAAFINLDQGSATVIPIEGQLKISLDDIDHYFAAGELKFVENNKGLSLLSCIKKSCQSHIENATNQVAVAKKGLSIWYISDKGKVKKLAHINQCKNKDSFNAQPTLEALVDSVENSAQGRIILIGHNSVFCRQKQAMIRWFKPFVLEKLENIDRKQPYIGIIELADNRVTEFVAKEYIQVEIELNR